MPTLYEVYITLTAEIPEKPETPDTGMDTKQNLGKYRRKDGPNQI